MEDKMGYIDEKTEEIKPGDRIFDHEFGVEGTCIRPGVYRWDDGTIVVDGDGVNKSYVTKIKQTNDGR